MRRLLSYIIVLLVTALLIWMVMTGYRKKLKSLDMKDFEQTEVL